MATENSCSVFERQQLESEVLKCLPNLKGFAMSLAQKKSQADDLIQQTVLQALAKLDSFEPGSNMLAWLFTILRNYHYSLMRKAGRETAWDPEFENTMRFSTGLSETGAEAAHDFNRLLLYVACLPADQSDALIAVGYLGMSYEEAAGRLDCAVGTIKSRVSRARDSLNSMLEDTIIKKVDLEKLKEATKSVPKGHPYWPIAKAYEELYAASKGVSSKPNRHISKKANGSEHKRKPTNDQLWEDLVASGALDDEHESLVELMQSTWEDT